MVAEDDDKLRAHLVRALHEVSYAVDETGDGKESLWLLGENDYDA